MRKPGEKITTSKLLTMIRGAETFEEALTKAEKLPFKAYSPPGEFSALPGEYPSHSLFRASRAALSSG